MGCHRNSLDEAVQRIKAARVAIDASDQDIMLVGRREAYLMQTLNTHEVIARLRAYNEEGADCLYAPGLKRLGDIERIVQSVDEPVNATLTATGLSFADMAAVGMHRVSATLAKATYAAFDGFVELLRDNGRLPCAG